MWRKVDPLNMHAGKSYLVASVDQNKFISNHNVAVAFLAPRENTAVLEYYWIIGDPIQRRELHFEPTIYRDIDIKEK